MLPTIQIGPLALPTSPLILVVSFMLALEVTHRAAARLGLNGDDVYNLGYLAVVAGLLGARLGYVLQYWSVYSQDLAGIFALNAESMSPLTGLAAGLLAGLAFAQRKGLDNRRLLDALTPGLLVLSAGLPLADLASGNGYGSPTSLPWAINLWNAQRHPVQVYHTIASILIGLALARLPHLFDGAHFALFVALYATSRLFLETFHGDSATIDGLRTVQIASLVVLIAALVMLRQWAIASLPMSRTPA